MLEEEEISVEEVINARKGTQDSVHEVWEGPHFLFSNNRKDELSKEVTKGLPLCKKLEKDIRTSKGQTLAVGKEHFQSTTVKPEGLSVATPPLDLFLTNIFICMV